MLNIQCMCGESMWDNHIPNELEYRIYSDKQMDSIIQNDAVDSMDLCMMADYKAWKCPKCSRIYLLDTKTDDVLKIYKPEQL